jgi:hypothetical protein
MTKKAKVDYLKKLISETTKEAREKYHVIDKSTDKKYEKLKELFKNNSYGCQQGQVSELVSEIILATTGDKVNLSSSISSFKEAHGPFNSGENFSVVLYIPSRTIHILFVDFIHGRGMIRLALESAITSNERGEQITGQTFDSNNFMKNYQYVSDEDLSLFLKKFPFEKFLETKFCEQYFKIVELIGK